MNTQQNEVFNSPAKWVWEALHHKYVSLISVSKVIASFDKSHDIFMGTAYHNYPESQKAKVDNALAKHGLSVYDNNGFVLIYDKKNLEKFRDALIRFPHILKHVPEISDSIVPILIWSSTRERKEKVQQTIIDCAFGEMAVPRFDSRDGFNPSHDKDVLLAYGQYLKEAYPRYDGSKSKSKTKSVSSDSTGPKVTFQGKTYAVKVTSAQKSKDGYIRVNGEKVELRSIRGKYRYVKL